LLKTTKRVAKLIRVSQKLEGLKRHTGVHAAGMVIANEEITNYSPLAKGRNNIITTQYDGVVLPQLGLLKIDFLGLRTLTIIDDCVKFIKERNPDFNLDGVPLDDKKTYRLLAEAKTMGVFQLESKGMRDLMRKLKPNTIEDIIALIALHRPGPMGSGMLDDFVNRKHGSTKIVYDHPLQESILKDTYGVILYQEQVMKMSEIIAGFTPGEADNLRKAMSKKIPEVIEKEREKFINGAKKKNVDKKTAEKIFNNITAFAGYGFNKSHSAAYGLISYKTAYLKANYPLEYLTALLNSEIGRSAVKDDEESRLVMYAEDTAVFGVKLLPPDVQHSDGKFKIEGSNIRFGLLAVKNVGEGVTNSIEQARFDGAQIKSFKDWSDFLRRINLKSINKKAFESLTKAGAFDSFGSDKFAIRASLLQNIDSSVDEVAKMKHERESSQGFLFNAAETAVKMQEAKPLALPETLEFEKEVLGFYISGHPLDSVSKDIAAYSNYRLDELPALKEDADLEVRIAGMIILVRKLVSKTKRESYARFKIEDRRGVLDAVVFPKNFKKMVGCLKFGNIVVVKGRLSVRQGQAELVAEEMMTIDEAKNKFPLKCSEAHIKILTAGYNDSLCRELKEIFSRYKGETKVYIDLEDELHGKFSLETKYLSECSDGFVKDVETAVGFADSVELRYESFSGGK